MNLRERSNIALISSITFHILLLLTLSVMGAFNILNKANKTMDVVFFDNINAGGSSGSAGSNKVAAPPKNNPVHQPAPSNDDISTKSKDVTLQPTAPSQPTTTSVSNNTTGNSGAVDGGTGSGSGIGNGTGTGSGTGSGDGTGDGVGSGSGSGKSPAIRPRLTRNVEPEYPSNARIANITGTVLIQVLVDTDGGVGNVEVVESSGNDSLDNAAVRAARQWQFTPARDAAGRSVPCYVLRNIGFSLKNR